jgi:hypothetical protein
MNDYKKVRTSQDVAQLFQRCELSQKDALFLRQVAIETRERARAWREDEFPDQFPDE